MKLLGRRGPHALVYDDGTLAGEPGQGRRHLWRAFDGGRGLVHLIESDVGAGFDHHICLQALGAVHIELAERRWVASFPFRPGVFLIDVLAQGAAEGGDVPVDAAVAIVAEVARAVARVHRLQRRTGAPLAERVRVGFDGDSALWLFNGVVCEEWDNRIVVSPSASVTVRAWDPEETDDDYDDRIGVYAFPPGLGRAPREEPSSPEEARGEPGGLPSDVFALGGLLWWALFGAHPFVRPDLLSSLDALRAAELPPVSRSDVPAPVLRLLRAALSTTPSERPTAETFAGSLALFVDAAEGRAAVAALTRGLFPGTAEADDAFVEEAALVDLATLSPPGSLPAGRANVPGMPIASSVRLVTHREVIASFDRSGRTLPPGFAVDPLLDDRPATMLSWQDAADVAADLGGRLPTEREWSALARGGSLGVPGACGVGELCVCWEWTSTPSHPPAQGPEGSPGHPGRQAVLQQGPGQRGRIVRGGPWRNREERALIDNRSWEDEAAGDVGFRVVFDRTLV